VGDWLLQSFARRLESCLRASDTAARFGGDEFVVLMPDLQTSADALGVAEKIRAVLEQPLMDANGVAFSVSSSIGVALYPDHGETEQDLLRLGDGAMYQAKKAGGNNVQMAAQG
jgi:diguanylate cyclase (GGDEF)-like protein